MIGDRCRYFEGGILLIIGLDFKRYGNTPIMINKITPTVNQNYLLKNLDTLF